MVAHTAASRVFVRNHSPRTRAAEAMPTGARERPGCASDKTVDGLTALLLTLNHHHPSDSISVALQTSPTISSYGPLITTVFCSNRRFMLRPPIDIPRHKHLFHPHPSINLVRRFPALLGSGARLISLFCSVNSPIQYGYRQHSSRCR